MRILIISASSTLEFELELAGGWRTEAGRERVPRGTGARDRGGRRDGTELDEDTVGGGTATGEDDEDEEEDEDEDCGRGDLFGNSH